MRELTHFYRIINNVYMFVFAKKKIFWSVNDVEILNGELIKS